MFITQPEVLKGLSYVRLPLNTAFLSAFYVALVHFQLRKTFWFSFKIIIQHLFQYTDSISKQTNQTDFLPGLYPNSLKKAHQFTWTKPGLWWSLILPARKLQKRSDYYFSMIFGIPAMTVVSQLIYPFGRATLSTLSQYFPI